MNGRRSTMHLCLAKEIPKGCLHPTRCCTSSSVARAQHGCTDAVRRRLSTMPVNSGIYQLVVFSQVMLGRSYDSFGPGFGEFGGGFGTGFGDMIVYR